VDSTVKVWITNFAGHDYDAAKKFGELTHITKGFISDSSLDRLKFKIIEAMQDFKRGDYLLLSGTNIINVIAVAYAFARVSDVKLLVFDKDENIYREVHLTMSNFEEIENAVS